MWILFSFRLGLTSEKKTTTKIHRRAYSDPLARAVEILWADPKDCDLRGGDCSIQNTNRKNSG